MHYGTINCKIVHKISPCNHLVTLICALKWKNLEFVKNPQPSPGCFETKITRASCVRAALQRLNHTCSRTILKGYIIGGNPFWSRNLISMGIHFKEFIWGVILRHQHIWIMCTWENQGQVSNFTQLFPDLFGFRPEFCRVNSTQYKKLAQNALWFTH